MNIVGNFNVIAIVLQVPAAELRRSTHQPHISVWARTLADVGDGRGFAQYDRAALPAINTAVIQGAQHLLHAYHQRQARVAQRYMVHFRSSARDMLQRWGIAWHYQSPLGTLIAQDDVDHWTLHTRPRPDEDLDRVDPTEDVEKHDGDLGRPADPCRVADGHGVEPPA